MRKKFTDRFISTLQSASPGKRDEHWDTMVPSFGVRITDRGKRSWILYLRWPGSRSPTRRKIGKWPHLPLKDAREIAWEWLRLVERGIDPGAQARQAALDDKRRRAVTLSVVAEAWFTDRDVARQRKIREVMSDVRREFLSTWGKRPITEITTAEIAALVRAKAERHPAQARNVLGYAKRLFGWAVDQDYGLEKSPAENLFAHKLIGKKVMRQRVLRDEELREVWQAAEQTEYPYGPVLRMLILTGQRKSEVGDATWSEFDLEKRLWTIPAERMKMSAPHVVPLAEDAVDLLRALPRFHGGDHLFSTADGSRPANGYSAAKSRLDRLIGDKIATSWVIHDLRRTMRTNLSALPITDTVRELMIAHAQPHLHRTYDLYSYLDEKRRGFDLWASRLRGITQSPGSNVIAMRKR